MADSPSFRRRGGDDNNRSGTVPDAMTLGLAALVWTLGEPSRADRLLALTGLDPDDLRARLGEPALIAAVIGFLANHEPDLIACAAAIGTTPEQLVAVGESL